MKNYFTTLLFVGIIFAACTKETTPDSVAMPLPPIDTTTSTIKYSGDFENGPFGTTAGSATIFSTNGKLQLRLENFRVSSGPDLKVYISREKQPLNFIRLGSLKGLSGAQVYDIPGNPDFTDYSYVLIHCEKFNHLFGAAMITPQ